MDQKRFLLFIFLSIGILVGWNLFVVPKLMPPKAKQAAQNAANEKAGDKAADKEPASDKADAGGNQVAEKPSQVGPGQAEDDASSPDNGQAAANQPDGKKPAGDQIPEKVKEPRKLPDFPEQTTQLGTIAFEKEKGYRLLVELTSQGAAVKDITLNDPRYVTLHKVQKNQHEPLTVVGDDLRAPGSLEMAVPQLGADADLRKLNWELVEVLPKVGPHSTAVFRIRVDDIEIEKRYELPEVDPNAVIPEAAAYSLKVDFTFRNRGKHEKIVNYVLQGPTGLPLENVDNTQKFRDVVVGFAAPKGGVDHQLLPGKTIAEGKVEEWKQPVKYIGVDVQFFAALLSPVDDQTTNLYTRSVTQQVVGPVLKDKLERSDVSVELTSVDIVLPPAKAGDVKPAPVIADGAKADGAKADGAKPDEAQAAGAKNEVTHSYHLFAGPKRDDVLPEGAAKVIDFGMFHWISRPMLLVLKFFNRVFGSWGIAIICLTIVVRSLMFPVSIKQARGAAKMQEIQPEIAALKEKYGNDKEKLARAQMELFRKHNYNPAAGCLPLFLQLPIFMGLYQSLNHAVDLRMAPFLWVENLAAPDALFRMPFSLPFLGQDFNLLPLITVSLFVVQQKMFMPPPANEEQALQQKMMNFMMIFMGVMFYKVPAGLCVYFIASSLWGMAERKLLPKAKPGATGPPPQGRRKRDDSDDDYGGGGGANGNGGGGLWSMLLKAAEKETSARRTGDRRK